MPQWDFLNLSPEKASAYPSFFLRMESEVTDLISKKPAASSVFARRHQQGTIEVRAI